MTVRGSILSLILVLACMASFAQQAGTGAKGKVANPDGLAAWYEKTLQLSGITVTGRAADKKVTVEKTSINPSASVTAATGSVLEVLRSSSTVTVDGSGQVSIRGNGNVLILVDGVPTTLDGLGSIPAANVQSIDIVTSPDAKYDAEGTGGIISITSKKQTQEAFTAMASANYGFNNFMNGNVAMSYNVGRWGVRLNYNGRYEKDKIESELHRQILQTGNTLDQLIDADKKTTLHNIGLNVNYKLTKQDVLTLDVKAGFPRMNNLQTMHNHYVTAGVVSDKVRQTDITFNREMLEGSLTYKHVFEPNKREVSTSASLSAINGHRPSYYYEANKAIQVSYSIDDLDTYEREVGGLVKFLKAYKQYQGIIVTWDTEHQITEDGITIEAIPIWKWLLPV